MACFPFQSVEKLFCDSKTTKSFRPPFSKGGGVEGRRPHRSPQAAKFLFQKSAGGAKNSPVDCFSVGNPRRGFPIILLLLCILPSDAYFFYTLKREARFFGVLPVFCMLSMLPYSLQKSVSRDRIIGYENIFPPLYIPPAQAWFHPRSKPFPA